MLWIVTRENQLEVLQILSLGDKANPVLSATEAMIETEQDCHGLMWRRWWCTPFFMHHQVITAFITGPRPCAKICQVYLNLQTLINDKLRCRVTRF